MNTNIFSLENKATGVVEWFWRERLPGGKRGDEHGPFDTRKEAAEAARAARRAARNEGAGKS